MLSYFLKRQNDKHPYRDVKAITTSISEQAVGAGGLELLLKKIWAKFGQKSYFRAKITLEKILVLPLIVIIVLSNCYWYVMM